MIQQYSWLGELMKIAGTDRDAARQRIESVTVFRLAQLFVSLAETEQPVAPLFLMVVPSLRLVELDRLLDDIVPAADAQVQSAVRKLAAQELEVKSAFDSALTAQANHTEQEVKTREFYFLQIGIREIRRGRVDHIVARQQRVAYISRIVKAEALRRTTN